MRKRGNLAEVRGKLRIRSVLMNGERASKRSGLPLDIQTTAM
jgi:hypothetical protein